MENLKVKIEYPIFKSSHLYLHDKKFMKYNVLVFYTIYLPLQKLIRVLPYHT